MSQTDALRIIGVELIEDSLQTYRDLHTQDAQSSETYPIMIWLSHPADPYEAKFLREKCGIIVDSEDLMCAIILETTIDDFKANIEQWNESVALASREAQQAREAALAEDRRLKEVAEEVDKYLRTNP
ncbi:hypothetical protein [Mycobacterium paraffinicum]|uniref:Uncharacterized protein n=1 Tax=Mycobacterium paraffinicum TaxID=53378 RepID=A0ABP8F8G2_9MYCO|nr:hypothetical protein [Mycobacterium paraffinicum]MCV7309866.1 hypothetical protein [Mycobacterium paraffinicum]